MLAEHGAGVSYADFSASVTFVTPYSSTVGVWDYGIMFRQYEEDGYQAIVLSSFGEWIHYAREGEDDDGEIRNGGAIPFYGVWGSNNILLTVEGNTGLLNINGIDVGALEVDNESAASDVTLIVGLFENSEVAGFFTKFKEFIVTEPGLIAKPTPRPTPTPTATPPPTPTPTPWVKSSAFLSIEREYKWLQLPRDTYWAWEVDNLTMVVGLVHVAEQLIDEIDAFLVGANRESIEYKTALEYRSDASYFVTTGTYYIREVEARPTPTPRPRPRATATPTPRPRPTATPTPRPRPRATATPDFTRDFRLRLGNVYSEKHALVAAMPDWDNRPSIEEVESWQARVLDWWDRHQAVCLEGLEDSRYRAMRQLTLLHCEEMEDHGLIMRRFAWEWLVTIRGY